MLRLRWAGADWHWSVLACISSLELAVGKEQLLAGSVRDAVNMALNSRIAPPGSTNGTGHLLGMPTCTRVP
eukprot:2425122-Alexandrium_andersonii.AAC.1